MWAPNRSIWPPPRCMFTCRCVGTAWLEFAERQGRVTTNVMVWKSWLMDSHCLREQNWLLTQHSCALSTATGQHDQVRRPGTGKKERACPELIGPHQRARLVVLAGEVGGRWSHETRSFRAEPFFFSCEGEWSRLGGSGGAQFCRVRQPGVHFLTPGSSHRVGSDGATPCLMRWKGISGIRGWGLEFN